MPSEMVERVARALCRVQIRGGDAPLYVDANWLEWVPSAEAAIEAMREPTKHMLMASGFGRTQQDKWRSMIDEARR